MADPRIRVRSIALRLSGLESPSTLNISGSSVVHSRCCAEILPASSRDTACLVYTSESIRSKIMHIRVIAESSLRYSSACSSLSGRMCLRQGMLQSIFEVVEGLPMEALKNRSHTRSVFQALSLDI